jgi:uncharacterized protein (TIGR03083 family)
LTYCLGQDSPAPEPDWKVGTASVDTFLRPPEESMVAYAAMRRRLCDLVSPLTDEDAGTPVPACPGWTVTDVVAHLYGVESDILAGNLNGVGTGAWADDQVRRFAPLGLAELLDRWERTSPAVEAMGGAFPPRPAAQFVFDACTHEHDIRGALGRPGARRADSVMVGLSFVASALDDMVQDQRLPGIELDTPDFHAGIGSSPSPVQLSTSSFELFRSFAGRRSPDQFRALGWQGDPAPFLAFFGDGPIRPPDQPLIE